MTDLVAVRSEISQVRSELRRISTKGLRSDVDQAITDILALDGRLDTAESAITDLETFDSDHVAASDPHTGYLLESAGLGGFLESATLTEDVSGFTNTSYADLDALTTDAFASPVAVTITTGTAVLVMITVVRMRQNTTGTQHLGFKVTGASSVPASDGVALRTAAGEGVRTTSAIFPVTGLTAGSNTFELQARVTGGNGDLSNPYLTVIR